MIFNLNFKKPAILYNLDGLDSNGILLHHHLGLGDHLTCNGLVNYLSQEFNEICLPVKEKNYKTVEYLYKNNKKIKLFAIPTMNNTPKLLTNKDISKISNYENKIIENYAQKTNMQILKIGHKEFNYPIPYSFYNQLNIPFGISKDYFQVNYDIDKNIQLEKHLKNFYNVKDNYILVHSESSKGKFPLRKLNNISNNEKIYFEKNSDIFNNIFYYLKVLKNAKEIHVINSSVFCLADRVETPNKLFFHNIHKQKDITSKMSFLKDWEIVEY